MVRFNADQWGNLMFVKFIGDSIARQRGIDLFEKNKVIFEPQDFQKRNQFLFYKYIKQVGKRT
ncbi:hypothetical protein A2V82_09790 [candidate division KSB1 bacterium RBG_16_48_16]|nr:MAG: hypothetical protein A2V82_09790 [candidate division KSB1 bacterium RBG_16_48_16]